MTTCTDEENDRIAHVAHAAIIELQAQHGDPDPGIPGDPGDAEAHAVTAAGIRAILDGATPEQLHGTWYRARVAQGWKWGPRKDSRLKTHPCLVLYARLPEHQHVKDAVFIAIVLAMSGQPPKVHAHPDDLAEQDHAEWRGWLEAQGYDFDDDSYHAEAFAGGMQAQRDLDAAQRPKPAPELAAAMAQERQWQERYEEEKLMRLYLAGDVPVTSGSAVAVSPELGAAIAERDRLRDLLARRDDLITRVLGLFSRSSDGMRARMSQVAFIRLKQDADMEITEEERRMAGG